MRAANRTQPGGGDAAVRPTQPERDLQSANLQDKRLAALIISWIV